MTVPLLPQLAPEAFDMPDADKLAIAGSEHPPRILVLYGSLRPQSFSRKLALEAERLLQQFGAETRVFHPHDLPILDSVGADHPEVQRLRAWSQWSEGQVWVSPERHGTLSAVFKNQIDWLPLSEGSVRPTQGRTLAVMQVCGGSQSFNVVNALRVLGRGETLAVAIKSVSVVAPGVALVRYDISRSAPAAGGAVGRRSYVSAISFVFSGTPLRLEDRFDNPLGFQVTRYRRDLEGAGA